MEIILYQSSFYFSYNLKKKTIQSNFTLDITILRQIYFVKIFNSPVLISEKKNFKLKKLRFLSICCFMSLTNSISFSGYKVYHFKRLCFLKKWISLLKRWSILLMRTGLMKSKGVNECKFKYSEHI